MPLPEPLVEAQDSDLRVDAEQLSGLSGLDSHQPASGRSSDLDLAGSLIDGISVVDVDGAVTHSDALQALFAAVTVQNEAGAHQMSALLGLDQLQSGTDSVGGGGDAQQAVSLAHLDQRWCQ